MIKTIVPLLISLHLWQGIEGGSDVLQTPSILYELKGNSAQINCTHSKGSTYRLMYWYQQLQGQPMTLVAFTTTYADPEYENSAPNKFLATKKVPESGSFTVMDLKPSDSAIYFCSVSRGSGNPAYFGNGTKLTVLDPDTAISEPQNISITTLSEKEKCKKHITLVCVVMNFYPDHLKINWEIGNKAVTAGVATDNEATKNANGKYDMSSRLKVPKEKWNKAENKFTCTYSFYNGKTYSTGSDSIHGIRGGDGYDRETHIKSAQMIKLGYGVFIAKSGLYGLIILVFVLKQGSAGK